MRALLFGNDNVCLISYVTGEMNTGTKRYNSPQLSTGLILRPSISTVWLIFLLIYVTNVLVYLLLFIVYINDIKSGVNVNICLFADDTSLYIVVDHPNTACTVLSSDLQTVYSWSQILLAPYSTAISRQSTPGPRYCLHRTQ